MKDLDIKEKEVHTMDDKSTNKFNTFKKCSFK